MTDVLVLCYHAVSPTWDADLSVTPEHFEAQVGGLVRRGWRGATFVDAVLSPRHRRTLAVTFDDAFATVTRYAAPILERLGVPATVFVPTAFPDSGRSLSWPGIDDWEQGPQAHELAPMGWDQLRELAGRGWEIGAHTITHPRLTQLDDVALEHELRESREECERQIGVPCRTIAYPYGDVDDRVAAAASRLGYDAGACLSGHLAKLGPLRQPRIGIYYGDTAWRSALKMSRFTRALRASRLFAR